MNYGLVYGCMRLGPLLARTILKLQCKINMEPILVQIGEPRYEDVLKANRLKVD